MACTQGMLTVCVFFPLVVCSSIYTHYQDYISCGSTFCGFGEEAVVTCTFHQNIRESKMNVSVERFVDANDLGTNVLTCTWKPDDNFECSTAPEYTLDKNFTNTLTLRIANATKAVVGTYKCQVVPTDGTMSHVCNFIGSGSNTTQPTNECNETGSNTTQPTNECNETDDHPSPCVFWVVPTLIALASIALNVYQFFSGKSKTKTNAANNSEAIPLLESGTLQQNASTPDEVRSGAILVHSHSEVLIEDPETPSLLEVGSDQPLTQQKNVNTFDEVESRAIFELSASEVLIDTARHR